MTFMEFKSLPEVRASVQAVLDGIDRMDEMIDARRAVENFAPDFDQFDGERSEAPTRGDEFEPGLQETQTTFAGIC